MAILRTEQELEKKATTKDRYSVEFTVNDYLAIIADIKASGGLSFVTTDASLTGDGTLGDPLSVVATVENLAATLAIGNTTGGTDVSVSAGDAILLEDSNISYQAINFPGLGDTALVFGNNGGISDGYLFADDITGDYTHISKSGALHLKATTPQVTLQIGGNTTTIGTLALTGSRTINLQNASGTLAFLSDIPADTSFPSDISDGLSVLQVSAAGGTFGSASDSSTVGVGWGSASNSLQPLSNHIVSLGTSGLRYANIFSREFLASIGRTNISGYSWTGITDDRIDNTTGVGGGPSIVSDSRRVLKTPSATGGADVIIATNMSTAEEGNASACLEVQSTVSGFLNARMTTVQRDAIGSPAAGLQIYNTTSTQFEGYNGSSWIILG